MHGSRCAEGIPAQGLSLEQIGRLVERHPSTVSYWLLKYDLAPTHRAKHVARGGIEQATLEALVESGASSREMAEQLGVSIGTVRHWLRRYGLQTRRATTRRSRQTSTGALERTTELRCARHGLTPFRLEGRGIYRCLRCRTENVARRRRKVKSILVREAGGRCHVCGYDRFIGALQFHHLDPASKSFNVSGRGITRSLEYIKAEAKKCTLLCSNCHAEVEAGLIRL